MEGGLFGGRMWAKISFCFFVSTGRLDPGERDYTWQKITPRFGRPRVHTTYAMALGRVR